MHIVLNFSLSIIGQKVKGSKDQRIKGSTNQKMNQHVLSYGYLDDLNHIHASPWSFRFNSRNREDRDEKIKRLMEVIFKRATMKPILNHEHKSKDMSLSFPSYWSTVIDPMKDEIIKSLCEKDHWVYNDTDGHYTIGFSINFTEFEVWSKGCDKKLIKWKE